MDKYLINELKKTFSNYCDAIISNDNEKIVSYIYPEIFEFTHKSTILDVINEVNDNPTIKIQFISIELTDIKVIEEINNINYVLLTTDYTFTNEVLNLKEDTNNLINDTLYNELKDKYGETNVSYSNQDKKIKIKSTANTLAIKTNSIWKFLAIKEYWLPIYEAFLPKNINEYLTRIFPFKMENFFGELFEDFNTKPKKIEREDDPKNIKRIFLAGWEVNLKGDNECENFIATQITNADTIDNIYSGLELVFKDNKLIETYDYEDGDRKYRELKEGESNLSLPKYPINKILTIVEDELGVNQIGGEIPSNFKIPQNNCIVPFQYLGFIDNDKTSLDWLPFRINLICPLFLNFNKLFLDYSNPLAPLILNKEEIENADTEFGMDLNKDSEIVYNEIKFNFAESLVFEDLGHSGIPNWIQYPEIPNCPKSGFRMKFLCQLTGGTTSKRTNVKPKNEWYRHYYEELNFGGGGNLFVFFEPTSKVACYFIQHT